MLSYLLNPIVNFSLVQETKTKISYPLTLSEVKRHLRIDPEFDEDDDYLNGLIFTGTQIAENFIEKDIAKTLTVVRFDEFNSDWIRINDGNFLSLVSVHDKNDASLGTVHQTSKHDDFFQIEWTTIIDSDPVEITYYSGFEPGTCPPILKQAILIKIGDLYDSARSDYNWNGMQDNKVFEQILSYYKIIRF